MLRSRLFGRDVEVTVKHRDEDTVRLSFLIGRNESGNYREFFVISVNGPCFLYISVYVVEL